MESLDDRKGLLLKLVVRKYVRSAEPVGSEYLSDNSGLKVSPATIRNELVELEDLGFLRQPHTSAGRVPTETGYRYYVERFLEKRAPSTEAVAAVRDAVETTGDVVERFRLAAKALAEVSAEAALVGFGPRDVYYTGLTNLFSKPEFRLFGNVTSMSRVLDHLDEVMESIFPSASREVRVLIGSQNPFGQECGTLMVRAPLGADDGVVALLGPMRMDYDADYGLLEAVKGILENA